MKKTNMQEVGEDEYLCLSFNNFGFLSEIAAKISDEFQAEVYDSFDGDEDFEFSLVSENPDNSTTEFIYDGQTKFQKPIFPVFNRDLLLKDVSYVKKVNDLESENVDSSIRIPLRNLFLEEGESTTSSSVDDIETIPPGTYCVWKPKMSEPSPGKCKKSKSTGFVSKRWPRIRDLLRRSNSEGKVEDSFVFLTPKKTIEKVTGKSKNSSTEVVKMAGKLKQTTGSYITGGEKVSPAAHQALCRAGKEADKNRRKSYLPYRQDLIGFFAIGLNRSYRPF
ncbi:uncharacterized protein LOC129895650 [Solanum dulcamara]|uniref:uncharacterized protein LOC129895650 n=1 Tax=Solanum dulcamara TaxID=45834 RepID=UPI0024853E1C|nr:uncharacterized protein LOC129895650 [Solanum dulcamara]